MQKLCDMFRMKSNRNRSDKNETKHKKYLQDLFDGKYKDEPTLNSKEFLQAEKEFLTDIEKFKMKFNNEELLDAIDELTESFTKYESVVRREAFIVGVGFGMRMR